MIEDIVRWPSLDVHMYVHRNVIPQQLLDNWFNILAHDLPWPAPRSRFARKQLWFTQCQCPYEFGRVKVVLAPHAFPKVITDIYNVIAASYGLDFRTPPNSAVVNLYLNGEQALSWHADDESLFGTLDTPKDIVSFSLGASRPFAVRRKSDVNCTSEITANAGDTIVMSGLSQKHCFHSAPVVRGLNAPRLNITWRWITDHSPKCILHPQHLVQRF